MKKSELLAIAGTLRSEHKLSSYQAADLLGLTKSQLFYKSRKDPQTELRKRLHELAEIYPKYGYMKLHQLLREEGWLINKKRVFRLYSEEGLSQRRSEMAKTDAGDA